MKKNIRLIYGLFLLSSFLLSSCAFVNVPLVTQTMPLREQLLEGEGKAKILLVDISGVISEKERAGGLKERPSLVTQVKESLQKAEQDGDIAGVVLKIDSPGGTVTASDIIHHELTAFRRKRNIPVHACITGTGTSGALYIAAAADTITAHPTAITGSIGVITLKFNVEGLLAKIGVGEETLKSADKKDLMSPFRQNTAEEKAIMQAIIQSLHGRFVDVLFENRKKALDRKALEVLADGRIYTARQAADAKLIDGTGYLDDVITAMKRELNVEHARIVTYFRPGSYKGTIYSSDAQPAGPAGLTALGDLDLLGSSEFLYLWRP